MICFTCRLKSMEPLDISDLTEQQAKFVSVLAFNSTLLNDLMKCAEFWGKSHWCSDCTVGNCEDCYSDDTHHDMEVKSETILGSIWDEVKNYDERYITDDSATATGEDVSDDESE